MLFGNSLELTDNKRRAIRARARAEADNYAVKRPRLRDSIIETHSWLIGYMAIIGL